MRQIDEVTPIANADRIESYRVGGWMVVDRKGSYEVGDYVVYVEPDAFMPTEDPRYAFLGERGERTMTIDGTKVRGHVLKTVRLRGQISQGVLFDPHVVIPEVPEEAYGRLCSDRTRLDGLMCVREYAPDESVGKVGLVGGYDSSVAPRTDAERVQNVDEDTYDLVRRSEYYATVKVDGTSITATSDPQGGSVRAFSHNYEFDVTVGRGRVVLDLLAAQGLMPLFERRPGLTLQMELCGPGIQKNPLRLESPRLFVFSVWDMDAGRYLGASELADIPEIQDSFVPVLHAWEREPGPRWSGTGHVLDGIATPSMLLSTVDGFKGAVTKGARDEGMVVHVTGRGDLDDREFDVVRNALGESLQMKAVSNSYIVERG